MNTTTKLNAKTLMQLLAIAMITLTLFSCGGGDTVTPPATDPAAVATTKVSTLSALATGEPSQVNIYWSAVEGVASYKLYKSTTTLSNYQNASPANLSTSSTVTFTTHTTNTMNITLSGTQTVYFLVTAIKDGAESFTNATQTAATAFTTPFLTVVATDTNNRVWMDRNLGATQAATGFTDALAYGDLYQWGRSADGHQARNSATRTTLADSVTPTHGQFITEANDWTTADSSGALRSANWAKIDGSSICPTGFRVPTSAELTAERVSWSSNNRTGAFASNLKWSVAGLRSDIGAASEEGDVGYAWSLTPIEMPTSDSFHIYFNGNGSFNTGAIRLLGYSVRCIKD